MLLARRSAAAQLGLPVLGRVVGFAVVGVPPEVMGIGPAVAIPAALKNAGGFSLHVLIVFMGEICRK